MSSTKDADLKNYWWLFAIWPFLAIVLSLRSRSLTPNLLWAFIVFYGFTFVISADNQASDITRYILVFQKMHEKELGFTEFVSSLYAIGDEGTTDLLQPFISYTLALFTDSGQLLITAFSFVFGFFYSRNVWLLLTKLDGPVKWLTGVFLFVFLLVVPIWNVNGFRFWTAAHIFFYGTIQYIMFKRKTGVLFVAGSALVHFSFLIPIFVFLLYLAAPRRSTVFFVFFIVSIFFNSLEIDFFNQLAERYLPSVFVERADSYTSEAAVERFQQRDANRINWYALYYKKALLWMMMFLLVVQFVRYRDFIQSVDWLRALFAFTFLLFGVANFLSLVPSGVRFAIVSSLFACTCVIIVIHYQLPDGFLKRTLYGAFPLLMLFVLVSIREGFNSIGVNTLFSNVLIAFFAENSIALIDVFKWSL